MNTKHHIKYPPSMILLHGVIAVCMIAALIIGWILDENRDLMGLHKSLGITVLFLTAFRIVNRLRVAAHVPESVNPVGSLQRILEKSVHGLLYITMITTPIFGWLLSSAAGRSVSFFGLFDLPMLMAENPAMRSTIKNLHELSANVFFGLLVLHIVGGIVHMVKEKRNIFKRMLP